MSKNKRRNMYEGIYILFKTLILYNQILNVLCQVDRRLPEYKSHARDAFHLSNVVLRNSNEEALPRSFRDSLNRNIFDTTIRGRSQFQTRDGIVSVIPPPLEAQRRTANAWERRGMYSIERQGENRVINGHERYPELFLQATRNDGSAFTPMDSRRDIRGEPGVRTPALRPAPERGFTDRQNQLPIHERGRIHTLQNSALSSSGATGPIHHLRRSEASASQIVPSFNGNAPHQFLHFSPHPFNLYNGGSNEAFQYGIAVQRTPLTLTGRGLQQNRGRFSGEPIESLHLPFEPLSVHYEKFRQSQNSEQTNGNPSRNGHGGELRDLGVGNQQVGGVRHLERPGFSMHPQNRNQPQHSRQILPVSMAPNGNSLQEILGLSDEAIRTAAAQHFNTTSNASITAVVTRAPTVRHVTLLHSGTPISVNRVASGRTQDIGGAYDRVRPGTGQTKALVNTAGITQVSGNTANLQNTKTNVPMDARTNLINEIGKIIDMVQLLNILNGNEAGEGINIENGLSNLGLGEGFVD